MNFLNKIESKSLRNYFILSSITSFIIYLVIILTGIAMVDYILFYKKSICLYNATIYAFILITALLLYFVYFKNRIKKLIQKSNVDSLSKIAEHTSNFINKHRILEMFTQNLVTMVENNEGIGMWIKDEEDKYVFANKQLRYILLGNKETFEIVGKTDGELLGYPCNYKQFEEIIKDMSPKEYPNIPTSDLFKQEGICNTTDVITRVLKVPCRFYEEFRGRSFDVFKTPLLDNQGNIIGTVGTLFDTTDTKDKRRAELTLLEKEEKAFRINSSNNYYIKHYKFGDFI